MPRRNYRRGDPTLVFAIFAVLGAGGMIAAIVSHHNNQARLAAYRGDPTCGRLTDASSIAPAGGSCSETNDRVTAQWRHTYKGSSTYLMAAGRDSFSLVGSRDRADWERAPVGTAVVAERFVDPGTHETRVTALRIGGDVIQTGWNPEYRGRDTMIGIVFLGLMSLAGAIGTAVYARRRTNR